MRRRKKHRSSVPWHNLCRLEPALLWRLNCAPDLKGAWARRRAAPLRRAASVAWKRAGRANAKYKPLHWQLPNKDERGRSLN